MKKMKLTTKILISLFLGVIFGLILSNVDNVFFKQTLMLDGIIKLLGTGFLNAIKMLVVPLVFVSIVYATASLNDVRKIGRIGSKTFLFYTLTTALAIIIAIVVANVVDPGVGINLDNVVIGEFNNAVTSTSFIDTLLQIIPTNIFDAFSSGNVLGILFFAVLTGISIAMVGEKAKTVLKIFEELNHIMLTLVQIVMKFAPIGVFALIVNTFATFGFSAVLPLFKYTLGVVIALTIQLFVVYIGMLALVGKVNPKIFLRKILPVFNLGLSTASSSATLPLALETAEKELGVSKKVSSFTLPLGATINMDGTAIMQGVAVVFIAQMFGIELGINEYIMVIMSAVLASIGTAGVPGAGIVMLTMVLSSVNLPIEGIAIIMGIDRIIDMMRTAVNVVGDSVCTVIVAKQENELDEDIYNNIEDGKSSRVVTA